jgi:hypothetical protein
LSLGWRKFWAVFLDALQLALAVSLFMILDGWLSPLFTAVPLLGNVVSTILGALITLGIFSVIIPLSRIDVTIADYSTRASIAGPQIELPAAEHKTAVARYDLEVRYSSLGYIGGRIAQAAFTRGTTLQIAIGPNLLLAHVRNGSGRDTDHGVAIDLVGMPPEDGTWQWSSVSFDTAALPGQMTAAVSPTLEFRGQSEFAEWLLGLFIQTFCTVRTIHVVRTS